MNAPFGRLVAILVLLTPGVVWSAEPQTPRAVLVIHGGAGSRPKNMTAELEKQYRAELEKALRAGRQALERPGGSSLDAVETAIRVLEDSPLFNAGRGAVFTHDGRNELDASIMEGKSKRAGAVTGVTCIKNPISAARAVMEKSRHVLLAGRGAELFATRQGLEIVDPAYFWTRERWLELQDALKEEEEAGKRPRQQGQADPLSPYRYGTVGAVAVDPRGHLAAGTSTGGMTNKMSGRIGDSPIIGAGTYADNEACAISCTGHGEVFIRYSVAHDVVARVKYKGLSVQKAAAEVFEQLPKEEGGLGGLIGLDANGGVALSFDTDRMYRGYITADNKVWVQIGK
jgi:beta-aspartyl-peptidase (threonine type)